MIKKTRERYWAVRIGNPGKHFPYFMLGEDQATPALFVSKEEAADYAEIGKDDKIVRVWVTE